MSEDPYLVNPWGANFLSTTPRWWFPIRHPKRAWMVYVTFGWRRDKKGRWYDPAKLPAKEESE